MGKNLRASQLLLLRDHPEILLNPSGTLSPEEDPENGVRSDPAFGQMADDFCFLHAPYPDEYILRVKTF